MDSMVVQELLAASRLPDGLPHVMRHREQLLGTVDSCLSELSSPPPPERAATSHLLLLALRVVRNLCAGGPAACQELLRLGAVAAVGRLLDLVESAAVQLDWQLPLVAAQLLANAATAGPACAEAVWQGTFPRQLNALAHLNSGPAQSALAFCLLSCCRHVPGAAAELYSPQGAPVMAAVLYRQERLQQEGQVNDSLGLLLSYLCFRRDLLPHLAASLVSDGPTRHESPRRSRSQGAEQQSGGASAASAAPASGGPAAGAEAAAAAAAVAARPALAHVALLQELSHEAQAEGHLAFLDDDDAHAWDGCQASMRFLVALIDELGLAAARGLLSEGQQQVLQDALQLVRDIAGNEEPSAAAGSASAQRPTLTSSLQAAGLLPLLLSMLKALGPIRSPQHPQRPQHGGGASGGSSGEPAGPGGNGSGSSEGSESAGLPVAELAPALAERAQQLPSAPPYFGYRADLLAALANTAYGRPGVKVEAQALGGVELVLSQCQMDRDAPLAREWALWGVRNLSEGNEQAQAAIRELQLCTAVETEEARQLGVRLELDKATGKLRVVQQKPTPGPGPEQEQQEA